MQSMQEVCFKKGLGAGYGGRTQGLEAKKCAACADEERGEGCTTDW